MNSRTHARSATFGIGCPGTGVSRRSAWRTAFSTRVWTPSSRLWHERDGYLEGDIPRDSRLLGLRFRVQQLVFDFGVNPLNFISTNAAEGAPRGWGWWTPGLDLDPGTRPKARGTSRDPRTAVETWFPPEGIRSFGLENE